VADHNDPNAIHSIFSDIDALTFPSVREPGVPDQEMLFRIQISSVFADSDRCPRLAGEINPNHKSFMCIAEPQSEMFMREHP
jgi:hypothetical protein